MAKVFDRVAIDSWLNDEIVRKFPQGGLGDIKLGSPCIVNPNEIAVFVRGGKALGTFQPGTHVLTTANIPWLTDFLEKGLFGGANVFTADVYYLKAADMTFKWGTAQPIIAESPNTAAGAYAIVGNGTYVAKVKDPWRFLQAMDAMRDSVRLPQLKDRLDPMLGVMLQDKLSELVNAKNLGPAQIQSFSKDLNDLLVGLLQSEFDAIGMVLVAFNIRLGLHPNSLEIVTRMGYGTSYTQMKTLDVGMAAAQNTAGGGLAETGMGMMGMSAMQQQMMQQQMMQQQMMQQQAAAAAAAQQAPPPAAPAAAPATPPAAAGTPDVMTPAQAAAIVQVDEADIVAAIEAGDLKARKIGASYRISKAALDEFLAG
ncbi:MAG: SPFH domain-containing protein [Anaerolineae bacterium]|nr:SPFH domain-containing protein [Anaerolineae bacterium]